MDKKEAVQLCACRRCPTHIKDNESIAFCIGEKSKGIKEEKGCLCPACPVQQKMVFKHVYYCTRGTEKSQSAKK